MARTALNLKALAVWLARPWRALSNRVAARRAAWGRRPEIVSSLPEGMLHGDADAGQVLVSGYWRVLGRELKVAPGAIWDVALPEARLEAERQGCAWLDDLAALGSKPARLLAQAWVQDWIRRHGRGTGPGWTPELAGRRARHWAAHAAMLTQGLDPTAVARFWRAMATHQRYLARRWDRADPGLPRLRALGGLVWCGRVLAHPGRDAAAAALGALATEIVDADGGLASRSPGDLAEAVTHLIWAARVIEDTGRHPVPEHLASIARAVPVLRPLRMGDGAMARFHGGGGGSPERLDQALAELRLGVQAKPKLAMGFARLTGGRLVLVMDGAAPPGSGHASSLAFEMSIGRQPVVVNAGPGQAFGGVWAQLSRETSAQSTVEVDGRSSARIEAKDFAARTLGPRLVNGPTLVSVRQAQDATGMWLLGTHDGYAASHGLLHERRVFVESRGREARGEEILTVTDARARAQFDKVSRKGQILIATRFHLHPAIEVDFDLYRQVVTLTLPSGEIWMFRTSGGTVDLEETMLFDPREPRPVPSKQMVVRTPVVEYLGQITWSFGRVTEAPSGFEMPETRTEPREGAPGGDRSETRTGAGPLVRPEHVPERP